MENILLTFVLIYVKFTGALRIGQLMVTKAGA
jgi:hypothetical protein